MDFDDKICTSSILVFNIRLKEIVFLIIRLLQINNLHYIFKSLNQIHPSIPDMKDLTLPIIVIILLLPFTSSSQKILRASSSLVSIDIGNRKLPSSLVVGNDIRYEDDNGNGIVDALESGNIVFTVSNKGSGPALGLKVNTGLTKSVEGIEFGEEININTILPNSQTEVKIPVKTNVNLSDGNVGFVIGFVDPGGTPPPAFTVEFTTASFKYPNVRMDDYLFSSQVNSRVSVGTPASLKVIATNAGQGVAEDVHVSFNFLQRNVYPIGEKTFNLGTLNPGENREVKFDFLINKLYTASILPVQVSISEKYGLYAETKTVETPVHMFNEQAGILSGSGFGNASGSKDQLARQSDVDVNIPKNDRIHADRYALIIGNEDYRSYQPDLETESNVPFAVSDARIFKEYVCKTLGVPEGNIKYFENAGSTLMRREISRLSKLIQSKDGSAEIIFYYAGHGFPNEKTRTKYLVPVDVTGAEVQQGGVPLDTLYSELTRYPSSRITVFLDACFSGGGRQEGLVSARSVRLVTRDNVLSGNIVVFSACTAEQEALQYKEQGHGMFTYFLLKTLQESKGQITYSDLFNKVSNEVKTTSIWIHKGQTPTIQTGQGISKDWGNWKLY